MSIREFQEICIAKKLQMKESDPDEPRRLDESEAEMFLNELF